MTTLGVSLYKYNELAKNDSFIKNKRSNILKNNTKIIFNKSMENYYHITCSNKQKTIKIETQFDYTNEYYGDIYDVKILCEDEFEKLNKKIDLINILINKNGTYSNYKDRMIKYLKSFAYKEIRNISNSLPDVSVVITAKKVSSKKTNTTPLIKLSPIYTHKVSVKYTIKFM